MILQALVEHYETLAEAGKVSRKGWCHAKVAFGRCSIPARVWYSPFRPLYAFVELLALCEVERNGERDERCGFKCHDVGDNSALTIRSPLAGTGCACGRRLSFAASLRDAAIAPFNVSHAPWDRSLVSYTFCSCSDCASVRNAVQRDGREGAHGLGR